MKTLFLKRLMFIFLLFVACYSSAQSLRYLPCLLYTSIKNDFEKALDEAFDNGASGVSFFDGPSDEYLHRFKAYLDKKGLKTE